MSPRHPWIPLALLLPTIASAQTTPVARSLAATRTAAAPAIDGRLDDAAWTSAPVAGDFVQHRPRPGARATDATEVRVLHDDRALYVAVRNRDARPDSVVGRLARRDQPVYSDWFTVLVDSHHDRRTAFAFSVNPLGVQRDWVVTEDTREDAGWDAVWEVATAGDGDGWTAEFRIPLSQLRFSAGARTWGINFARLVARRDELAYWSPVAPDAAGLVSQFGALTGLRDLRPPRRLELQPYTVARAARAPGAAADPFHRATDVAGAVGADLEYGVTSDLTLAATFNPDFGQVEADPSQVNLTAFESWYEEKRPFFTEGAGIFGIGFPQLVYSRRIGARPRGRVGGGADFTDAPEQTSIVGAAKLTGRTAGGWTVGVLDAVTARESARWIDTASAGAGGRQVVEPATNYLAARVSRDFGRGASSVGAIATAVNRAAEPGLAELLPTQAYVAGLTARHRFAGGRYEVEGSALSSVVAGTSAAIARLQQASTRAFQRPDAAHVALDPQRTSLGGYAGRVSLRKVSGSWRWTAGAIALSPEFEANDLGFVPQVDELRVSSSLSYERFREGNRLRNWAVELAQGAEWSYGGEPMDATVGLIGRFRLRNHWGGSAMVARSGSALDVGALRGGPALREPGRQWGSLTLHGDPRRPLRAELDASWSLADAGGARALAVAPSLAARPSDRLELAVGTTLEWNRDPAQYVGTFDVDGRREYLVGRIVQATTSLTLRADYTFRPTLSLQLYAQPFVSAGRFDAFRAVRDARARALDRRFRAFGPEALLATDAATRAIDLDGHRAADLRFADPSFNVQQLDANAVLRWEYRPGSTLFVVWGQQRDHATADGRRDLRRDAASLFRAPGTNVLAIKASYWLGM